MYFALFYDTVQDYEHCLTAPSWILPALGDLLKTPTRRKDAWTGMRLLRRALDA